MSTSSIIIAGFGLILTFLNIIDKIVNLKKNANAPFKDLESRVSALEIKQKENENRFKQGNDQFRNLYSFAKMFMQVQLAFVDFETAFCQHTNYTETTDLEKAKKTLQESLTDLKTQM